MEKINEYIVISDNCINSHWKAKFLAEKGGEYCECPFECKIKVKHTENGMEFIINEDEYKKLFKQ